MAYHKVECPSREIRDAAVADKEKSALVAWGGYSVSAEGFKWFLFWIE